MIGKEVMKNVYDDEARAYNTMVNCYPLIEEVLGSNLPMLNKIIHNN
jgi:hypothetical protein